MTQTGEKEIPIYRIAQVPHFLPWAGLEALAGRTLETPVIDKTIMWVLVSLVIL